MLQQANRSIVIDSPFYLCDNRAYLCWREDRLSYRKPVLDDLLVQINDPYQLSDGERLAITERCSNYNMVLYQLSDPGDQDKSLVHALGKQLGMQELDANLRSDEDSVSSLQVRPQAGNQYIPYTNKALSWHTDGYYNSLDKQIFGIIMHCVRPAAAGGVNALFNPEDMYIRLRDENPAYIEALMHPEAMTIPDNVEAGKVIRKAQAGPVFLLRPDGRLHMRYSARKRNIVWRNTEATSAAVEKINQLLADETNVFKIALRAGQGIICSNVLHNRTGFTDSETQKRLMYRARYFESVNSE
jgi:alpha-ketoglutarate-dependent taurine dioxygenase